MRINGFGEAYCVDSLEIDMVLSDKDLGRSDVYLSIVNAPEGHMTSWSGEIAENASGDLVCFVEAESEDALLAICEQAGVSTADRIT